MHKILITFLFIQVLGTLIYAQTPGSFAANAILVKKGNKTVDLKKYNYVSIRQNVMRNNEDSLQVEILGDSISVSRDTLIVRPWNINEYRFAIDDKPSSRRINYDNLTSDVVKISIHEIEKIKVKRQPFCFISSSIVAAGIISTFAGLAIPPKSERQINLRTKIVLISYPVWIFGLTTRLAWGEKRMRFDKKRTKKNIWTFQ